ncbi:helix-turn-helix domain-containing protein [Rathayibacter sp. VKM Ac-2803]|uniref:transcriptional regulator n=1 Tax=unclassified Rathayibacter TaxID=2609250 RepID=UPI001358C08C|nr:MULTISPECIES: transcriptional regulator [unclassified Rathayibacter]MWV50804.1 helix-turn-helix domain-containing protein [Rathayibacter sp. VKM Ac-2803]MWV57283.1 helix-turn-helix domain-containing protein [Rathayibacter sp. VKM Ac-2754]
MSAEARFDELIHAPLRLRICGLLRAGDGIDFGVLRDTLGIADASLSKNLKLLADAGLVAMSKSSSAARSDSRRVTWVALTPAGSSAFDAHVAALRAIARGE